MATPAGLQRILLRAMVTRQMSLASTAPPFIVFFADVSADSRGNTTAEGGQMQQGGRPGRTLLLAAAEAHASLPH